MENDKNWQLREATPGPEIIDAHLNARALKHGHYFRWFRGGKLDIYRLLSLFDVSCPTAQHVAKKAICAGQRGAKNERRDWEDIRDTAIRKLEMLDEDEREGGK